MNEEIKNLIFEKLKENPEKTRRLKLLLEEQRKRQEENLCKRYIPNIKCEKFIENVGNNKHFVNLFSAANGVGKTCVGVNVVANICFGTQNQYFDKELFNKFPYLKRGRIISDPTTLKEKIVPELKKWFPSNRYKTSYETKKEGKSYEVKWTTDTGFEFDLMSNEQDSKEFESVDLGWLWLDEPSKKDIYTASIARMRRGGIVFWTMTPLSYSAWIKDDIYDKQGETVSVVTADVWDNCLETPGARGMLKKENIDRMISQYPEDEKEARIYGKFGHLLGRVHKLFDRRIHVINPFKIDFNSFTCYGALDTHPRVPDAYTIMAVDDKDRKYIISELFIDGTDTDIASAIKQTEAGLRIRERLIDPSAWIDDKRTEENSVGQRLEKSGLSFTNGSKNLIGGIRRTDEALMYTEQNGEMIKPPEVYIFNTCERTIKEFENYVWDEYRGRGSDEKDPKPRPKDINDHFIENIHRLLIQEYKFVNIQFTQNQNETFNPYDVI
jgi:phage terminase large subunit-like protein